MTVSHGVAQVVAGVEHVPHFRGEIGQKEFLRYVDFSRECPLPTSAGCPQQII